MPPCGRKPNSRISTGDPLPNSRISTGDPLPNSRISTGDPLPNSLTRAVVRSAVQRLMIDASSRCDAFLSKSRPLIGTNRCTNPTSSRRENSQTALRAVDPSSPPPLSPPSKPGGEGEPSGYGSSCLANINFCWYKFGSRISRISRIGLIKRYFCTVYLSMNSTTGVGSSSPCGWWPTPGLRITSKTPPNSL